MKPLILLAIVGPVPKNVIGYRGVCPQKWCPLLTSAADYEIIVNHKINQ